MVVAHGYSHPSGIACFPSRPARVERCTPQQCQQHMQAHASTSIEHTRGPANPSPETPHSAKTVARAADTANYQHCLLEPRITPRPANASSAPIAVTASFGVRGQAQPVNEGGGAASMMMCCVAPYMPGALVGAPGRNIYTQAPPRRQ